VSVAVKGVAAMRRGAFANLMVIGALVVAACSSDNGAQAPSTAPVTPTTTSSTAPPTTAALTTSIVTTLTVATTLAPSTAAPSSVSNPPGAQELRDLYRRYYAVWQA
jgi:hypothetical protein